jgi:DNA repair protein RadC
MPDSSTDSLPDPLPDSPNPIEPLVGPSESDLQWSRSDSRAPDDAAPTAIGSKDPRQRFRKILEPMRRYESFTSDTIKADCKGIRAATITKTITQLRQEGWLIEQQLSDDQQKPFVRFRWQEKGEPFSIEDWIDSQLHGNQITQQPLEERPRERLLRLGAAQLKTAELLAILIRMGRKGESALQAGERIASRCAENMDQLHTLGLAEIKAISKAVSEPAYCQIMAGIELGRRVSSAIDKKREKNVRITSADAAMEYCRTHFARMAIDARQEEFHIVTLDTKYQPITNHRITVGTLDASLVHPREVFRPAIRDAAAAIILLHNHPSGDPTPSKEDRQVTRQLEKAGETVGISILDHIIVAGENTLSLKQWEQSH